MLSGWTAQAQFCGTVHDEASMHAMAEHARQTRELLNNGDVATYRDETIYIPVKYHIISNSSGVGGVKISAVLGLHCRLNQEYAEHGVQFFIRDEFNFFSSTNAYENPGDNTAALNFQRDAYAMNIFIGQNANPPGGGSIGVTLGYYNPGSDWIVMKKSEVGYTQSTLPHEAGHFFSLPHPFQGWDCTFWTEWLEDNPDSCAPTVAPCSSIAVEKADGSNCNTAGDFICDTPADYNCGFGWSNCSNYTGGACDSDGEVINPMENNHMGYFQGCDDYEFTMGQEEQILANIASGQRQYLTFAPDPTVTAAVTGTTELLSPASGATTSAYNGVELDWSASENATRYLLEIALTPNFSVGLKEYILFESAAYVTDLEANKNYFWRVTPYNLVNVCAETSPSSTFTTNDASTSVQTIAGVQTFDVMPNPVTKGANININLATQNSFNATVELVNVAGQVLKTINNQAFDTGLNAVSVNTDNLVNGLYFVRISNENGIMNRKVMIAE